MGLTSLTGYSSILLLFDNSAYTRYILPKRSDKEYVWLHKSTISARCKSLGVKKLKINMNSVFEQSTNPLS